MLALCVALSFFQPAVATEHPGRWSQERLGGLKKVRVPDGRVDIGTETHAIEVEFASKWKNAIGQALWYAMQTNKKAGIVVIVENARDAGDAIRLESVIEHNQLPIRVWRWEEDLPE